MRRLEWRGVEVIIQGMDWQDWFAEAGRDLDGSDDNEEEDEEDRGGRGGGRRRRRRGRRA